MMSEKFLLSPEEQTHKSSGKERRVWARFAANLDGVCQPMAATTANQPEQGWPGEISDISCGGIKLSLERRFHPGTALIIELAQGSDQPSQFLEVRVVRATPGPQGGWVHGCEFLTKLGEEDLQLLV